MLVRSLESLHQVPGWVWASLMLASEEGRHRAVALLDGVIRAMADREAFVVPWSRALSDYARTALEAAQRELGAEE